MNKSKIEWCNYTWNSVTGCLHDCPYCYARGIARRFSAHNNSTGTVHTLDAPIVYDKYEGYGEYVPTEFRVDHYPFVFDPTFHRYRLDEPQTVKRPSTVFVCSMADLFGNWVPDEWIEAVLEACAEAPQHRYLFLTKNPKRYVDAIDYIEGERSPLNGNGLMAFFGATATNTEQLYEAYDSAATWLSIEPLIEDISTAFEEECLITFNSYDGSEHPRWGWVVIGAETGNRKGKVTPKREWIENIIAACKAENVPIFMKSNLVGIFDEAELIQQYPWGTERSANNGNHEI